MQWGDYGVAGLAAGIAFWAMQLAMTAIKSHRDAKDESKAPPLAPWLNGPACLADPQHLATVNSTHQAATELRDGFTRGAMTCNWTQREVGGVLQALESIATSTKETNQLLQKVHQAIKASY